jgi:hypothetical protein
MPWRLICVFSFTLRSHYHFGRCFHLLTGSMLVCMAHLITTTVMSSSLFWAVTQKQLVVGYRRFGTTYRSHLQWPSSPRRTSSYLTLKMGPIGRRETSVTTYHSTLRNTPEDQISYLHRDGNLKSYTCGRVNAKSDEGPYRFQPHTECFIPNRLIFQTDPQIIFIIISTLICSITSEYKA